MLLKAILSLSPLPIMPHDPSIQNQKIQALPSLIEGCAELPYTGQRGQPHFQRFYLCSLKAPVPSLKLLEVLHKAVF